MAEQEREYSDLDNFVKIFTEEFIPYLEKYAEAYNSFEKQIQQKNQSHDEKIDLLYFVVYLFQKFESDNLWLVDRLQEFGKENNGLKEDIEQLANNRQQENIHLDDLYSQLKKELEASKSQLLEFDKSKDNL